MTSSVSPQPSPPCGFSLQSPSHPHHPHLSDPQALKPPKPSSSITPSSPSHHHAQPPSPPARPLRLFAPLDRSISLLPYHQASSNPSENPHPMTPPPSPSPPIHPIPPSNPRNPAVSLFSFISGKPPCHFLPSSHPGVSRSTITIVVASSVAPPPFVNHRHPTDLRQDDTHVHRGHCPPVVDLRPPPPPCLPSISSDESPPLSHLPVPVLHPPPPTIMSPTISVRPFPISSGSIFIRRLPSTGLDRSRASFIQQEPSVRAAHD